MMRIRGVLAMAVVAMAGGAAWTQQARAAAPVAASVAVALRGHVVISGTALTMNEVEAYGSAPPSYSKSTKLSSYSKTTKLPDDTSLVVNTGPVYVTAASKGLVGTQVSATASTLIQSGSFTLTNSIAGQVLSISAASAASNALFTKTTAGAVTVKGSSSLTSLVIDLNAFGGKTLTYSGKPKRNTVLYASNDKSVIVYLNRQRKSVAAPAAKTPTSVEVLAVDVHLTNAKAFGVIAVSGDVQVGTSYAN